MKNLLILFLSLFLSLFLWVGHTRAQPTNLVVDGGFEDTLQCGYWTNVYMYQLLNNWGFGGVEELGGVYFNSCYDGFGHPPLGGAPQNSLGYEQPHTGSGYGSIVTYIPPPNGGMKNYAFGKLNQTLQANKRYRVTCYVSRMDSCIYACNNFQVYFSDSLPIQFLPTGIALHLTHPREAVFHQDLKSKEGWTKLDTTFVAAGNERFITLGNFISNVNSDGYYVGGNPVSTTAAYWFQDGPAPNIVFTRNWAWAGYYLDDVSVVLDDDTGLEGTGAGQVSVFPNPNTGSFVLRLSQPGPAWVEVSTLAGQVVWAEQVQDNQELTPTPALSKGFYIVKVMRQGRVLHVGKMVVQ